MTTDDHVLKKHSVQIAGHGTSISVENIFWRELKKIAARRTISLNALIMEIDEPRDGNLSSAIRIFVLNNKKV
jgi:predicted DNA-binding ribbon-helix-helix protein